MIRANGSKRERRSEKPERERERERRIGENSLSIHVVYTRRTLELKIEPGNGGARGGRARGENKDSQERKKEERREGVAGERGDTLISERIYKRLPRVPRIVRPSPTSYIYR